MHRRMIPLELAVDQVRAYRYAFQEAVHRANDAIAQRDRCMRMALDAECARMEVLGECPDGVEDPCPLFFGGKCEKCRKAVDGRMRYV